MADRAVMLWLLVALSACGATDHIVGMIGTGTAGKNRSGRFIPTANHTVEVNPVSLALGDLNGDDQLDLVVAHFDSNSVSVLLGRGQRTNASFDAHAALATRPSAIAPSVGTKKRRLALAEVTGVDYELRDEPRVPRPLTQSKPPFAG